jgi:CheY-like chemotaxis protein
MPENWTILVAEDEENDFFLLEWAFRKLAEEVRLERARDGEEALAYIMGTGAFADRDKFPFPDLAILDLKMPRRDGFEVLEAIRQNPETRTLITLILSSSNQQRDVQQAGRLGANSFITKPNDSKGFVNLTDILVRYWLKTVVRPCPDLIVSRPETVS